MSSKVEDTDQYFLRSLKKSIQFWMKRRTSGSNLVKAFAQETPKLLQLVHKTLSSSFFIKSSLPTNSHSTVILEAVGCTKKQ